MKYTKSKGFTLIEMMVVAAVFCIIIVAVIGVFVSAVKNQRYILSAQRLLDQSSYAMEHMSKALRMAKKDISTGCIPSHTSYAVYDENRELVSGEGFKEGSELRFRNSKGECQTFLLENGQLMEEQPDEYSGSLPLISNDFEITYLRFKIVGEDQTIDDLQPRVIISFEIKGDGKDPQPKMKLQTLISQRDLDVEE